MSNPFDAPRIPLEEAPPFTHAVPRRITPGKIPGGIWVVMVAACGEVIANHGVDNDEDSLSRGSDTGLDTLLHRQTHPDEQFACATYDGDSGDLMDLMLLGPTVEAGES